MTLLAITLYIALLVTFTLLAIIIARLFSRLSDQDRERHSAEMQEIYDAHKKRMEEIRRDHRREVARIMGGRSNV